MNIKTSVVLISTFLAAQSAYANNHQAQEIGRAHVTPVTSGYLVCRLLLEKKKKKTNTQTKTKKKKKIKKKKKHKNKKKKKIKKQKKKKK